MQRTCCPGSMTGHATTDGLGRMLKHLVCTHRCTQLGCGHRMHVWRPRGARAQDPSRRLRKPCDTHGFIGA